MKQNILAENMRRFKTKNILEQEEVQSHQRELTIHDIAANGLPNGKTTGTFTIEKEGEFHILKLDGIRIG